MAKTKAMKATTVRFSDDLWAAVSVEAEIAGVSASQFIREAALARAAAAAGARGEVLFGAFPSIFDEIAGDSALEAGDGQQEMRDALSQLSRAMAGTTRDDAKALRAESQAARRASEQQRAERARTKRPT
jgi:hypothetical protein